MVAVVVAKIYSAAGALIGKAKPTQMDGSPPGKLLVCYAGCLLLAVDFWLLVATLCLLLVCLLVACCWLLDVLNAGYC